MTHIIDGKAFALKLRESIAEEVAQLSGKPGLAVVLVGEDPASQVYVRNKHKATIAAGMESFEVRLPADTSEDDLIKEVDRLNHDEHVHGILVQLPLPGHIDENIIINTILPAKDVDGFHVINSGRLMTGQPSLVPCTPQGCMMLIKDAASNLSPRRMTGSKCRHEDGMTSNEEGEALSANQIDLSGKHAVVIGRSNIVGKPMAQLLLQESCTVTICHSRTTNIEEICQQADILIAAVGRPKMVNENYVKDGAIIIDVGINRLDDGSLCGDVDFDAVQDIAGAITPVPGGVGPMTIACLLKNTVEAFKAT